MKYKLPAPFGVPIRASPAQNLLNPFNARLMIDSEEGLLIEDRPIAQILDIAADGGSDSGPHGESGVGRVDTRSLRR